MNDEITILHVDDDDDIRVITELSLSLEPGFKLHQCACGPEAIALAPEIKPDVILLDMEMPGMNGEETWKHLLNEAGMQDTPTIFMSARAEENFAKKLMVKGALAIITKPFDPITLGQQIRDALISIETNTSESQNDGTQNVFSLGVSA